MPTFHFVLFQTVVFIGTFFFVFNGNLNAQIIADAIDDNYTIEIDSTHDLSVLDNDILNQDLVNIIDASLASHGAAMIDNKNNTISYTPSAGYIGQDSFTYTIDAGPSWENIGPDGGWVTTLAMSEQDRNIIYAGTNYAGMFKSTDGGNNWFVINNNIASIQYITINKILIHPNDDDILYIATNYGAFKSSTGGENWDKIRPLSVNSIALNSNQPNIIYIHDINGIHKSTDDGESWVLMNSEIASNTSSATLAIDSLHPDAIYFAADNSIYKSTNAGSDWSVLSNNHPYIYSYFISPVTPGLQFLNTTEGLLKSNDGGLNWIKITPSFGSVLTIAFDITNDQTLFAGIFGGVAKSIDGGDTWELVNTGFDFYSNNTRVQAIIVDPVDGTAIYSGTQQGIYKTTTDNINWLMINHGLNANNIGSLVISNNNIYANGVYHGTVSNDDPVPHWQDSSMRAMNIDNSVLYLVNDNLIYANNNFSDIYKSTDHGYSWQNVSSLPDDGAIITSVEASPSLPSTIFVGTNSNGIYKSIDGGSNWEPVNMASGLFSTVITTLAVDPNNPEVVFKGVMSDGIFKSTNGGTDWHAWEPSNILFGGHLINKISIDTDNTQIMYAGTGQGVFKSTDGGMQWARNPTSMGNIETIIFAPNNPEILYAGGSNGIFKSVNSGGDWYIISPKKVQDVLSLAINPNNPDIIYAGTKSASVYMHDINGQTLQDTATVTIDIVRPNTAPVIDPNGVNGLILEVGESLSAQLYIYDVDNDAQLQYTISDSLFGTTSIDHDLITFHAQSPGHDTLLITVTDSKGASNFIQIPITILEDSNQNADGTLPGWITLNIGLVTDQAHGDSDNDGILDALEIGIPENPTDSDNDGIYDVLENSIDHANNSSVLNFSVTPQAAANAKANELAYSNILIATNGNHLEAIANNNNILLFSEEDIPYIDEQFYYPFGILDFNISLINGNTSASIAIKYHDDITIPVNASIRKLGINGGWSTLTNAQINRDNNTITLTLVDNKSSHDLHMASGVIMGAIGLAIPENKRDNSINGGGATSVFLLLIFAAMLIIKLIYQRNNWISIKSRF